MLWPTLCNDASKRQRCGACIGWILRTIIDWRNREEMRNSERRKNSNRHFFQFHCEEVFFWKLNELRRVSLVLDPGQVIDQSVFINEECRASRVLPWRVWKLECILRRAKWVGKLIQTTTVYRAIHSGNEQDCYRYWTQTDYIYEPTWTIESFSKIYLRLSREDGCHCYARPSFQKSVLNSVLLLQTYKWLKIYLQMDQYSQNARYLRLQWNQNRNHTCCWPLSGY